MSKYIIGIIDEDPKDVDAIKRTILENKPDGVDENEIAFSDYNAIMESPGAMEKMIQKALCEITEAAIQLLIVDYKIIVSSSLIEGSEIFRRLDEVVPKFPIIILSNVPDVCYEKNFIDADKIYEKGQFFKIEEKYSKEKTLNLFRNMDHYREQKAELSLKYKLCLSALEENGYSEQTLQELVKVEKLLDDFCPMQLSVMEKQLNVEELQDAVDLIAKAKKLLGEDDET